jgi:glycosyltransferase involved in cell wall biosynthesis
VSPRRLLILSYFYPPLGGGGVHRVLGFTRHLPAWGWACTVVCAGENDYWVKDESLAIPPSTEVIRVTGGSALSAWLGVRRWGGGAVTGRRPGRQFASLRRLGDWWLIPDSYVGWSRRAARVAASRLARGDIDAVLSTSPPDSVHLAALRLRRRQGVPWVADFRDPWIGLHFRAPPTAWHRARQAGLERRVMDSADLVTAASRLHVEQIGAQPAGTTGSGRTRTVYLPNGFEPCPSAAANAPNPDFFTLVFTGTLSLMPDTEVFLEALHDLLARRPEARRRIRARLAGAYDLQYEDRAVALGLRGIVEFLGPLTHPESRALQGRADLLMLWKPRGEGYRTMVPGKLYEYLDAGRPVLALIGVDEEAAALVRRGGGTVLEPGRRADLVAVLEERYLAWKAGERTPSTRAAWLEEHTRARLAARLAEVLEQARGGPA